MSGLGGVVSFGLGGTSVTSVSWGYCDVSAPVPTGMKANPVVAVI